MTTKPVPWQQTFPKNTADEFTCLKNCRAIVMSQPQSTSVLLVQCPQWPAGNHWIGLPRNSCMEPHLTSNEAIPILDQNNICDMALLKFTDAGNDGNTIYVSFMQVHELHQCIPFVDHEAGLGSIRPTSKLKSVWFNEYMWWHMISCRGPSSQDVVRLI